MNSIHRAQSRAKRHPASFPKFWQPKLDEDMKRDAQIIHWDLVTRFTDGTATTQDLWDWMETGFTYTQMMRMLAADGMEFTQEAQEALAAQLETYEKVIERYRRTKRVAFNGPEYLIAKAAANVMDALIELDRHGIAERAARWSMAQMANMPRFTGVVS